MDASSFKTVARVQAVSGVVFAFFAILHLITTASASTGIAGYDGVLVAVRAWYRPNIVVELLLIGVPAVAHVVCAVMQIRRRWGKKPPTVPLRIRAHRWSGYFILAVLGGHVFATRILPAAGEGPAEFSFLAYSILNWPYAIIPYYVAFAVAGALHVAIGLGLAATILTKGGLKATHTKWSWVVGVLAAVIVAYGVIAMVGLAPDAREARFDEYKRLFAPFMP